MYVGERLVKFKFERGRKDFVLYEYSVVCLGALCGYVVLLC